MSLHVKTDIIQTKPGLDGIDFTGEKIIDLGVIVSSEYGFGAASAGSKYNLLNNDGIF
jgi:hypothetical protein